MKRVLFWIWIFALAGVFPIRAAVDGLNAVDQNEGLTNAVGYDRLSKFLIDTADRRDQQQRINRHQLLDVVVAELLSSGKALEYIEKDLKRGDVILKNSLMQVFQMFNYSTEQANLYITRWATEGADSTIRATIRDAARKAGVLRILSEYCLRVDQEWTSILAGLDKTYTGQSPITINLLADTLVRTRALTEKVALNAINEVQQGNVAGRWRLTEGVQKLLDMNGALVRFFAKTPAPEDSWNFQVWKHLVEKIERDPLLRTEYLKRLANAAPLYDAFRDLLIEAIANEGVPFMFAYLNGSNIQGSRYEWVADNLSKTRPELKRLKRDYLNALSLQKMAVEELVKKFNKKGAAGDKWVVYFLWHLTRLSEPAVIWTKHGIQMALGHDEEVIRKINKDMIPFGPEIQKMLVDQGAFSYYEGGEADFRSKIQTGTIDREALLQYGAVFGKILKENEDAWNRFVTDIKLEKSDIGKAILISALETETNTLLIWLTTIRNNAHLKEEFSKYLLKKRYTRDASTFNRWIDSVGVAIKAGNVVGNTEVADFRNWFIDFLQTRQGWSAVVQHIELESTTVPRELRKAMTAILLKDEKRFWRIYGMLTSSHGPSVTTLIPKLHNFIIVSRVPWLLVEEIGFRNIAAADAIDPAWDLMFEPDSLLPKKIMQTVVEGSTVSDVYRLSSLALTKALSSPSAWQKVQNLAYAHLDKEKSASSREVQDELFNQIQLSGADAMPFIIEAFKEPVVVELWRRNMKNLVRFLGQAHVAADFIQRDTDLRHEWEQAVAQVIASEPDIMRVVLESLATRRAGDMSWDHQLAQSRKEVIDLILQDRVLFEQLCASKNGGFKEAFAKVLKEKTGMQIQ